MDDSCPMSEMCQGMFKSPKFSVYLSLLGFLLVFIGMLIFIEPSILVWLMGGFFVLLGLAMLTMTAVIRKRGAISEEDR
jgi:hypothetical protein